MKKEWIYNKETIYYTKNFYDNIYYKSYGNISQDNIYLELNNDEIRLLKECIFLLTSEGLKTLTDIIVTAKNLGIRITYRDILTLIKEILLLDFKKTNQNNPDSYIVTSTEEKREEERREEERREEERRKKEEFAKNIIDKFMNDITSKEANRNFRGWVLPNGLLISQYNETTDAYMNATPKRQDHCSLILTFMAGLEEYDKDAYDRMQELYNEYLNFNGLTSGDISESFAVERLGWMQVSVCGTNLIAYRAERWQDRILRPFFIDYGFKYIVQDRGRSYEMEFSHLYAHLDEIMKLGLRKRYQKVLK